MGREEQVEEREVLDSIFPDEIHDISESEFRISLVLDVTNDDGDETELPILLLQVKFSDAYPDESPVLDLLAPPNAPNHPYFSVAEDKNHLLEALSETIEENLGMAMVFTLVSTLKDNAEQLIRDRQAAAERIRDQRLLAVEQEENKKFHGTPVNPETFTKWREAFRNEMVELRVREEEAEEIAEKKKNRGKETMVQLTGKQLWERGMVGKVDEDDEDQMPVEVVEV